MLVALIVGLVVSLLQALTQIQEQTLIFVPKILAVFAAMILMLPFMGDALAGYMDARDRGATVIVGRGRLNAVLAVATEPSAGCAAAPRMTVSLRPMSFLIPELATAFMLTFARVGTLVMLMPGIGEQMIPVRVRLGAALLLTLVLFPLTRTLLPAGGTPDAIIAVLIGEIAVGLVLGLAVRMVVGALQTAGNIVAQQLGLAFAMSVDPAMGGQQAAIGNFLTLLGITLIFAADLHHLAIAAIRDSYAFLPPAGVPEVGDAATLAIRAVGARLRPCGADLGAVHRLRHPVQSRPRRALAPDAAAAGLLPRHAGDHPDRHAPAARGARRHDGRVSRGPRRVPRGAGGR